jgi:tetratricopeptide (TPR) repeat protein
MSTDSTEETPLEQLDQDEQAEQFDPIEDAWLGQEPEQVEKLARERLAKDPEDAGSHAWLGLALCITSKTSSGQASLKRAFEIIRGKLAKETDEEQKHMLTWELHGIANRLVDTLAENPTLGIPAAQFVVDGLKFEHAPSLRMLSEDVANREGDPVKAAGFLKRALAVDATDPESHYLAARLMARLGKKPQVLSHLQKALDNAAGTIAVRTLARFEPDFDGFRKDPEFSTLIDLFPQDAVLRPIYIALDAGDFARVVELSAPGIEKAANKLDVYYPWREAIELLLDDGDKDKLMKELERVQAEIDKHEEKDEESAVYQRFCGDA